MRDDIHRAHDAYNRRAWADAHARLIAADESAPLAAPELELLATAAYLLGRDDEAVAALDRAHQGYLAGPPQDRPRAARCAFWAGLFLMFRGEIGHATGWLARAQRLVAAEPNGCVEAGYLLVPAAEQQLVAGELAAALATATTAAEIGVQFGDADLVACARHLQGRALVGSGDIERGLPLLDEAMLAITADTGHPVLAGLVYCSVIDACLQIYAFSRAREWTAALAEWTSRQSQLIAFTGTCVVHRAQIHRLNGAWQDALAEVRGACERFSRGVGQQPPGAIYHEQGEVHRLRGELDVAEDCYRRASEAGCEPQPGLALLRLAQGRSDAAVAAIRRVLTAATDPLARSRLLAPASEILLAVGDVAGAREASRELDTIATAFPGDALQATSAHVRAAIELAAGDPSAAVAAATPAWQAWDRLALPYQSARVRELLGRACGEVGDEDGMTLHLDHARRVFDGLGAAPDAARVRALMRGPARARSPLTDRELQVLRLIATGKTNKAIARELHVSEKTIERHVSNLLLKIDVPTRAAATAYAYQHKLI